MFGDLYAHIDQKDTSRKQTLHDHLHQTAVHCSRMGREVAMEKMLFYVGLLHDCGKAKSAFQKKIKSNSKDHVDHSTYGGLLTLCFLDEIYGGLEGEAVDKAFVPLIEKINQDIDVLIALNDYVHLLAYAIMSHHGPYDMVRKNRENRYVFTSFERAEREKMTPEFEKDLDEFQEHWRRGGVDLKRCFAEGFDEYINVAEKLKVLAERTSDDGDEALCFYQGMLARLVVSMLKSADIKDTINSYDTVIEEEDEAALRALVQDFETRVLAAYAAYGPPKNGIGRGRAAIADAILARSKSDGGGIYTLDLPTGAGKTLLSLRYGVNQMKYRGKRRFFYITSYLSVLEQNAETMKETLGHKDQVLEHHSNVVEEEAATSRDADDEKEDSIKAVQRQFLLGDWTSPVVLTTMVQFFNTLFKGKSANLTRFKSFVNGVVVLDELQSLPTDVLYMMNLALNFMKTVMKTTVVLSTATQPAYGSMSLKHRLDYGDKNQKNTALVAVAEEDKKSFERAKVALLGKIDEEQTLDDVAAFVLSKKKTSRLVILNTKAAVRGLYDRLAGAMDAKDLYYLTTNLTAGDRLARIDEIKTRLVTDDPVCVVSTQLIEAGVDADFAMVVRSLTGIDSIVQARGRCNREGKRKEAYTYVVNMDRQEENIAPLKGMGERKLASLLILREEEGEIAIEDFISPYFEKLYANLKKDALSPVFDLLSKNPAKKDILLKSTPGAASFDRGVLLEDGKVINFFQSFKEAYEAFELIDDAQDVAVVLCDETEGTINRLRDMELGSARFDPMALKRARQMIRGLSRHTVPLPKKATNVCDPILDGMVHVLLQEYYDKCFGLNLDYEGDFRM